MFWGVIQNIQQQRTISVTSLLSIKVAMYEPGVPYATLSCRINTVVLHPVFSSLGLVRTESCCSQGLDRNSNVCWDTDYDGWLGRLIILPNDDRYVVEHHVQCSSQLSSKQPQNWKKDRWRTNLLLIVAEISQRQLCSPFVMFSSPFFFPSTAKTKKRGNDVKRTRGVDSSS